MNLHLGIHDVTSVTTQARCLNGQWQTKLIIRCGDGSEAELTLYTASRPSILELSDEHVLIEHYEPKIERSATPFESASFANASEKS